MIRVKQKRIWKSKQGEAAASFYLPRAAFVKAIKDHSKILYHMHREIYIHMSYNQAVFTLYCKYACTHKTAI